MDPQPASKIESGSVATSDSAKAKYRPQQSCIKCRERKVKCDRAKPCRACCSRGLQSECEYIANNEDRFHISQADVIENLRREVNRLKRRLADVEQSKNATGGHETTSWWPRKAQKRTLETTNFPVAYAQHDAAQKIIFDPIGTTTSFADVPSSVVSNNNDEKLFLPWTSDPVGTNFNSTAMMAFDDGIPPGPWPSGDVAIGTSYYSSTIPAVFSSETIIQDTAGYTSSNNHHPSPSLMGDKNDSCSWEISTSSQHHQPQPTNLWKGKHELLQRIFNAICDCDDARVASIVEIIRTSASPEDAMALIHQTMNASLEATSVLGSASTPSDR
ncbi:hypothetical protein VTN77DRAFT_8230 [Rasamsonia byssochlamydoides]|uniref:uncharacterized protein n=1 Tax=Rasamsonia byssochlamydoides TaxID=89139 RepID=UPI003743DE62